MQPAARFALSRPRSAGQPVGARVGLSRDVIALAWSGHQWLKTGKRDAAVRMYREALEMASRAELSRLAAPAFIDDPQVRRYALPYEDLIGAVVRDMAAQEDGPSSNGPERCRASPSRRWSRPGPCGNAAPDADRPLDVVLVGRATTPEGVRRPFTSRQRPRRSP